SHSNGESRPRRSATRRRGRSRNSARRSSPSSRTERRSGQPSRAYPSPPPRWPGPGGLRRSDPRYGSGLPEEALFRAEPRLRSGLLLALGRRLRRFPLRGRFGGGSAGILGGGRRVVRFVDAVLQVTFAEDLVEIGEAILPDDGAAHGEYSLGA